MEIRQVTIISPDGENHEVCWQEGTEAVAIKQLIRDVCDIQQRSFFLVSMSTAIPIACSHLLPDGGTFEVSYPEKEEPSEKQEVSKEKEEPSEEKEPIQTTIVTKKRSREETAADQTLPPPKKKVRSYAKSKIKAKKRLPSGGSSPRAILGYLNTPRNMSKNKLFEWCRSLNFKPSESDKAAIKWELRLHCREKLGETMENKYTEGSTIYVFWDAAVGNDQKWYTGEIKEITGAIARIAWANDFGEDDLNLNHLYTTSEAPDSYKN